MSKFACQSGLMNSETVRFRPVMADRRQDSNATWHRASPLHCPLRPCRASALHITPALTPAATLLHSLHPRAPEPLRIHRRRLLLRRARARSPPRFAQHCPTQSSTSTPQT